MKYDVVVLGLGPAGAHFSRIISRMGYKVLAFERGTEYRNKTCAGGISPRSVSILKETYGKIPSQIIERKINKIFIATKESNILLNFHDIEAFTTCRSKFDNWLTNEALNYGTVLKKKCEPRHIIISNDRVEVKFREYGTLKTIRSNCIIGAYGARSSVQKKLKLDVPEPMIAVQCEVELPKDKIDDFGDTLRFFYNSEFSSFGYSWIFPKEDHITVGLLDTPSNARNLKKRLQKFLTSKIACEGSVNKINTALVPNKTISKTYGNRFILVGDAAGFSDRITWEGICYALESSKYAANEFIHAYEKSDFTAKQLSNYQKIWKHRFGKDLRFGNILQKMIFNENLDNKMLKLLKKIKEDDDLRLFLISEMKKHMSLVRAIGRLPLRKKIDLLSVTR